MERGILPDKIWNDAGNAGLRGERGDPDVLHPGDIVVIPEKQEKKETRSTEQRHRFRKKISLGVIIRLKLAQQDPPPSEDRFVLEATDHSYSSEKTVRDDQVPGDGYLDLFYSGLKPTKSYTLTIYASGASKPRIVFENVPYPDLDTVSPQSPDEDEPQVYGSELPPDAPYPEESDEEYGEGPLPDYTPNRPAYEGQQQQRRHYSQHGSSAPSYPPGSSRPHGSG